MVMVDQIVVPPGDVPPPACVPGTGLGTFDISFVDPKTELYVLADRTNAAVDFFDASDDTVHWSCRRLCRRCMHQCDDGKQRLIGT